MGDWVWGSQGERVSTLARSPRGGEGVSSLSVSTLIRAGRELGKDVMDRGKRENGGEKNRKRSQSGKERPSPCLLGWAPATQGTEPGPVAP